MKISLGFVRIFFVLLSILCMTTFSLSTSETGFSFVRMASGASLGLAFGFALIGLDTIFRRFSLRSFNIVIIGLLMGYLMGQAVVFVFNAIIGIGELSIPPSILSSIRSMLFLSGTYIGTIMTMRSSNELQISIPFVKFTHAQSLKKDIIIDSSSLMDPRIIDLGASGLLDNQLIIPGFVIKDLQKCHETGDEVSKAKAQRSLEIFRKLDDLPNINIRFDNTDFPEIKSEVNKLVKSARLLNARIMTADMNRIQMSEIDGIGIININSLSTALKPVMQGGESIKIKVQRYGKEPRQGIGYLDDGTMVVINGGGDHIGEIIKAQVLSVKHTSSGRMIFCNTIEQQEYAEMV